MAEINTPKHIWAYNITILRKITHKKCLKVSIIGKAWALCGDKKVLAFITIMDKWCISSHNKFQSVRRCERKERTGKGLTSTLDFLPQTSLNREASQRQGRKLWREGETGTERRSGREREEGKVYSWSESWVTRKVESEGGKGGFTHALPESRGMGGKGERAGWMNTLGLWSVLGTSYLTMLPSITAACVCRRGSVG